MALALKVGDLEPVYVTVGGVTFRVWITHHHGMKLVFDAPPSVRVERAPVRSARLARSVADTAIIPAADLVRHAVVDSCGGEPD